MQAKIKAIIDALKNHQQIALFHHISIDGDSLSCSYGLAQAIKSKYPQKNVIVIGDYQKIQTRFWYLDLDSSFFANKISGSYLAMVGDCAVQSRIAFYNLYKQAKTKIVFDHHQNKLDFTCDIFWQESSFIASAMQASLIAEALKIEFNEKIALNLVFGIITDSGRFKYSGVATKPLMIAAKLFKHIENKSLISLYAKMEKRSLLDLQFQAWVFANLQVKQNVTYAIIKKEHQIKFQKTPDQSTQVNLIANIENAKIWIMFIEYPHFIRTELRSNGIPVNKIASQFGGGGHLRAAGCQIKNFREVDQVVNAALSAIKNFKS